MADAAIARSLEQVRIEQVLLRAETARNSAETAMVSHRMNADNVHLEIRARHAAVERALEQFKRELATKECGGIARLDPALVTREQLQQALEYFRDEIRNMCANKDARAAVDLEPSVEAAVWHRQEGLASELCTFVQRKGSELEGIICASICINGQHTRHVDGGPTVQFKRGRKRARCEVAADIQIWHLWVQPSVRRLGCAARLLEAVERHAARFVSTTSALRLHAEVLPCNAPALRFWRRRLSEEEPHDDFVRLSAVVSTT